MSSKYLVPRSTTIDPLSSRYDRTRIPRLSRHLVHAHLSEKTTSAQKLICEVGLPTFWSKASTILPSLLSMFIVTG